MPWAGTREINGCFFGVPSKAYPGFETLETTPRQCQGMYFYLGIDYPTLAASFAQSKYPAQLKRFAFGNCTYHLGSNSNLDYAPMIEALTSAEFPELEVCQLGVCELFHNAEDRYGRLGDVSKLVNNMPSLKELGLYGSFDLSEPLYLPELEKIEVFVADFWPSELLVPLTQETVTNLLSSNFPKLIDLNLDFELDKPYPEYVAPPNGILRQPTIQRKYVEGIKY
jgi:hypothetical protein